MIRPYHKSAFTLTEIMYVVGVIGLLAAIAIPNFVKARDTAQRNTCIANLQKIDAAVQQWAIDNKKVSTSTYAFTSTTVLAYLRNSTLPLCPAGGTYKAAKNPLNSPTCSLSKKDGHSL
jgi:prepilin-type N-terminal cleavage/methylation domain-containing protein